MKRTILICCFSMMVSIPLGFSQNTEITRVDPGETISFSQFTINSFPNGDYILSATSYDTLNYNQFCHIICFSSSNQLLWQNQIESINGSNPYYLSGISIVGDAVFVSGYDMVNYDTYLSKFDHNGNELWTKKISLSGFSFAGLYLDAMPDGILLTASGMMGLDPANNFLKLDLDGNGQWSKLLSFDEPKNPLYDIDVDDQGDITVCGKLNSDMLVFSLNSTGTPNYVNCFYEHENFYTQVYLREAFSNEKQICAGYRMDNVSMEWYYFYAILDNQGNIEDMYRFPEEVGAVNNIFKTGNGNITIETEFPFGNHAHSFLHEINSSGQVQRTRVSSAFPNYFTVVNSNPANGYSFCYPFFENPSSLVSKLELVTTNYALNSCLNYMDTTVSMINLDYNNFNGTDSSTITNSAYTITPGTLNISSTNFSTESVCMSAIGIENEEINTIAVFPNPSNDFITIQSSAPLKRICIYDNVGKMINTIPISDTNKKVDISQLSRGVYLIEAYGANTRMTAKIIKE